MKRKLAVWALLAGVAGWVSPPAQAGKFMSQAWNSPTQGAQWGPRYAPEVPGYVGPTGEPIQQRVRSGMGEPTGADYAHAVLSKQYPSEILHQMNVSPHPAVTLAGFNAPATPGPSILPVAGQMPAAPGAAQGPGAGGMGGPNPLMTGVPGIIPPGPPGAVAALGALNGQPSAYGVQRTEVRFVGPGGMKISWYAPSPSGKPGFTPQYLEAPARYNFVQASIYRLKLSDIPNRPGVDLYPTLEIMPCNVKSATFLAHSAVPINFTEEDFEQVVAGNFVVKVIYLPDPQFQDLAATGPDEVVSSRLEPGVDPILEAKRRGTILAIIRLGNIDLEAPNTPAMDAPDPKQVQAMQAQQQMMMAMQQQQQQMMREQMMRAAMNPNAPRMPGMGMMPPGMMPNGMMPPGLVAPGMMPPGMMPPGMMPPGAGQPGVAGASSNPTPGAAPAPTTTGTAPAAPTTPKAGSPVGLLGTR